MGELVDSCEESVFVPLQPVKAKIAVNAKIEKSFFIKMSFVEIVWDIVELVIMLVLYHIRVQKARNL